jgi:broad specificity phosphatase PhoE
VTIYLVRHAHAGHRHDWNGDDEHRPLTAKGRRQVESLIEALQDKPITRVLSSAYVRCTETAEPIAERHGCTVEVSDAMYEGASTTAGLELVRSLGATEAVLISHGDVIPALIGALSSEGVRINGRRSAAKAGMYVIDVKHGSPTSATYVDPPGR